MIKKLLLSLLVLPSLSFADNPPPPPTLNDLSNASNCTTYANSVVDYLKTNDSFEYLMNTIWFTDFALDEGSSTYSEHCQNNVCKVQYDGNDHGCYIAGVAKSKPIEKLYSILTNAYNNAIHGVVVSDGPGRYGLSGKKNVCTSKNQFQDCNLKIS